jgi:hypothetical protein
MATKAAADRAAVAQSDLAAQWSGRQQAVDGQRTRRVVAQQAIAQAQHQHLVRALHVKPDGRMRLRRSRYIRHIERH